jgi:hypothetical protein
MKKQIQLALFGALPIEALNFCCSGMVLDPGNSPDNMPWYLYVISFEWTIVHGAGLLLLDWIERGFPLHPGHPGVLSVVPPGTPMTHPAFLVPAWMRIAIFVGGGYLTTVLLLFAAIFCVRRFLRWRRKGLAGAEPIGIRL